MRKCESMKTPSERLRSNSITSNQRCDAKSINEYIVCIIRIREQFGDDIQIWIHFACTIQQIFGHMQRRRMTIIQSDAIEYARRIFHVFSHVTPQIRTVFGSFAESQLNTVSPGDQFAFQINISASGLRHRKIGQWVGIHYPAVVRHERFAFFRVNYLFVFSKCQLLEVGREISAEQRVTGFVVSNAWTIALHTLISDTSQCILNGVR